MPEISIIVPVYNVEKYLPRCIDSILNQTFTNFELILVDDGSTDSSGKICDEYSLQDDRIKVLHKKNGGLSSARNAGLNTAIGSFICFVDSDDFVSVNYLKRLIESQRVSNADIIECNYIKVDSSDFLECKQGKIEYILPGKEMIPLIYHNKYGCGGSKIVWNKLYRKDLFKDTRFEEGRINEDEIITPILFYNAEKVAVISDVLYYYFQSDSSITRSEFSLKKLDIIFALDSNRKFYIQHNLKDAKMWFDTLYCFALIKYMKKLKQNPNVDPQQCEYKKLLSTYKKRLPDFLKNPYILFKQKLILIYERIRCSFY